MIDFGPIALNDEQRALLGKLNRFIPELIAGLPGPLRDGAALFVQEHYARNSLKRFLNFYDKYYPPAWTMLYWLKNDVSATAFEHGLRAQAMAMFLHMYDDHLTDGQIRLDHMHLQLRTHAWGVFVDSVQRAGVGVSRSEEITVGLLGDYFRGVHREENVADSEEYAERFRLQSATWLIVPLIFAGDQSEEYSRSLRAAYESFALAWRYLDDLRDWVDDAAVGERSALYYLLGTEDRAIWDDHRKTGAADLEAPLRAVFPGLVQSIAELLADAGSRAREIGLDGLAGEYEALRAPLTQ